MVGTDRIAAGGSRDEGRTAAAASERQSAGPNRSVSQRSSGVTERRRTDPQAGRTRGVGREAAARSRPSVNAISLWSAEAVAARLLDDEALLLDPLELALEPGDLAAASAAFSRDHRLGPAGRGRGLADLAGEQR